MYILMLVFVLVIILFTLILKFTFISRSVFLYIYLRSEVKIKSLVVEKFMPQVRNFGLVCTYFKPR